MKTQTLNLKSELTLSNRSTKAIDHSLPIKIRVTHGTAYVTHEGDFEDYILRSGDDLEIVSGGLTVIQGFPHADYKICA